MYYEEQVIDGILCWRSSPDDAWTPCTVKELTAKCVTLKQDQARLRDLLKKFSDKPKAMQAIMKKHGLVIDDLENTMQKLAFTFYTEIVEIALESEHALEGG